MTPKSFTDQTSAGWDEGILGVDKNGKAVGEPMTLGEKARLTITRYEGYLKSDRIVLTFVQRLCIRRPRISWLDTTWRNFDLVSYQFNFQSQTID